MATLKELNSQLAAAQKKHGAKSQAAGRIQYKINQLNKDSKGTAVKTKTGVLKSNVTVTPYKTAKITKGPQSGTAVNVLKGRPKNKPFVSTNPQVVKNLAAAKKKEDAQKKLQAARRKLSTDKKVKQRQKDYRNNSNTSY